MKPNTVKNKVVREIILLVTILLLIVIFFSAFTYIKAYKTEGDITAGLAHPAEEVERKLFSDAANDLNQLKVMSFWLLAIVIIVIFGFSLLVVTTIQSSFKKIMEGLVKFRAGQMNFRIRLFSDNEFGFIADSLNETMATLEDYENKLRETNQQLKNKIEDLEKTNKVILTRELKMIELKEELEKLKNHGAPSLQ